MMLYEQVNKFIIVFSTLLFLRLKMQSYSEIWIIIFLNQRKTSAPRKGNVLLALVKCTQKWLFLCSLCVAVVVHLQIHTHSQNLYIMSQPPLYGEYSIYNHDFMNWNS